MKTMRMLGFKSSGLGYVKAKRLMAAISSKVGEIKT